MKGWIWGCGDWGGEAFGVVCGSGEWGGGTSQFRVWSRVGGVGGVVVMCGWEVLREGMARWGGRGGDWVNIGSVIGWGVRGDGGRVFGCGLCFGMSGGDGGCFECGVDIVAGVGVLSGVVRLVICVSLFWVACVVFCLGVVGRKCGWGWVLVGGWGVGGVGLGVDRRGEEADRCGGEGGSGVGGVG
ncbi:hypothetical protein Tco_1122672 [Tanacetum coccineum]|uniref:Uncharacterized protein n=1 Tax=Tanacetum coccineum TaxID=301880 RepID=A0ABQ5E9T2_9ASTR